MSDDLLEMDQVWIESRGERSEKVLTFIESIRPNKNRFILKLKDYNNIEVAEPLRGSEVFVENVHLSKKTKVLLFLQQEKGIKVLLEDGSLIGDLQGLMNTPGHPVLIINSSSGKELLIPAVDEFIVEVDLKEKKLVISPPEGIFEIYDI
jgi:16S rRNA processing protein RimM